MRQISENPFYLLELPVDCSAMDVETQGQKLLAMLQLDLTAAKTYRSPLGHHGRDAESVRAAMASLRDPLQRLRHELFAQPLPDTAADGHGNVEQDGDDPAQPATAPSAPWSEAFIAFGWKSQP